MDLTPIPATAGAARLPDRCVVRGQRLVQVKFVALPLETEIRDRPPFRIERRLFTGKRNWGLSLISFIHRVIGRLVAARP
jgi:hypothetical protein